MGAADHDVIIVGAGAAGLMCAATAGYRGRRVRVIDHAPQAGRKILMSGGGRCNFTHMNTSPAHFLSDNPGFCISALKRFTARDFFELVERHGIDWVEKSPGQLFCVDSSRPILDMLLTECEWAGVDISLKTSVTGIERQAEGFRLHTSAGPMQCASLVVASGGLSIPTMGATGFGYDVARQFGLPVLPTRAGLVPFTLQPALKASLSPLSGLSLPVSVACGGQRFTEPMLITHRGLSGPAMLQISSYWQPGETLAIDLLPGSEDLAEQLAAQRQAHPSARLETFFSGVWPRRFAQWFCEAQGWTHDWQQCSQVTLASIAQTVSGWQVKPGGTEGYRTAEVTLGGVDTRAISSRTFEARDVPGLYFIGEVLDVTGQLGGHNFQWAWSSGWCAGQFV